MPSSERDKSCILGIGSPHRAVICLFTSIIGRLRHWLRPCWVRIRCTRSVDRHQPNRTEGLDRNAAPPGTMPHWAAEIKLRENTTALRRAC
jgi:hypothetical protein